MLMIYRHLLRLYPVSHRKQFGEEMLAVFVDLRCDKQSGPVLQRGIFYVCEIAGLMRGAASEHVKAFFGRDLSLFEERFMMRDGFRFPKTTSVLMTLILAGIVVAIQKGESISASLPHSNPQIGPIQPIHSTLLPPIVVFLVLFYAAGTIGWIILFALRRSGLHRLTDISEKQ